VWVFDDRVGARLSEALTDPYLTRMSD